MVSDQRNILVFAGSRGAVLFRQQQRSRQGTFAFDIPSAVSAAGEAYRYVSAICIEKPDVCVKGAETFHALGERAKEGAKVAYELLDAQLAGGEKTAPAAELVSESEKLAAVPAISVEFPGNADTLKTGTIIPLPQKRPAP